jgi:hypothetical protein
MQVTQVLVYMMVQVASLPRVRRFFFEEGQGL